MVAGGSEVRMDNGLVWRRKVRESFKNEWNLNVGVAVVIESKRQKEPARLESHKVFKFQNRESVEFVCLNLKIST